MALSTYGELKTSIANWGARSDLTSLIPDFVALTHKQIMRDLRGHLRLQKRNTAFVIDGEYVAVPVDFLELISLEINTSPPTPVNFLPNDTLSGAYAESGTPKFVTLVGATTPGTETFRFAPAPSDSTTATIEYYSNVQFFPNDSTTNWILADHPDLYLKGSLYHLFAYIGDVQSAMAAQAAYRDELGLVKRAGNKSRWGVHGLVVRAG